MKTSTCINAPLVQFAEIDVINNIDDNISVQKTNIDLNNHLASWQRRNVKKYDDDTDLLFQSDSSSELDAEANSSACIFAMAGKNVAVMATSRVPHACQIYGGVHQVNESNHELLQEWTPFLYD